MTEPTRYPLGRRVNHDPRSRSFAFAARPESDVLIQSVSWLRRVPIFDQGSLGSCTGNAAAGWAATDNSVRAGYELVKVPYQGDPDEVDQEFAVRIYSSATEIDPFSGSYPPEDTGSDGLSVTKILKSYGLVDVYTHCFSLDDVLRALQNGPVLIGSNWYEGMFDPDSEGVVTISGPSVGGHEYLAVELNVERRMIKFANSWGDGWAQDGYFWMSYETLDRLLSEQGDATVPHAPLPVDPANPEDPAEPGVVPPFGLRQVWMLLIALIRRLLGRG